MLSTHLAEIVSLLGFGFGVLGGYILPPFKKFRDDVSEIVERKASGKTVTRAEELRIKDLEWHWRGFAFTWIVGLVGMALFAFS
jgi:hypothetical protein